MGKVWDLCEIGNFRPTNYRVIEGKEKRGEFRCGTIMCIYIYNDGYTFFFFLIFGEGEACESILLRNVIINDMYVISLIILIFRLRYEMIKVCRNG